MSLVTSPASALPVPASETGFMPYIGSARNPDAYEQSLRATFVAGAKFKCTYPNGRTAAFEVVRIEGAWVYHSLNGDAEAADGSELRASLVECGRWLHEGVLTPLLTTTSAAA